MRAASTGCTARSSATTSSSCDYRYHESNLDNMRANGEVKFTFECRDEENRSKNGGQDC